MFAYLFLPNSGTRVNRFSNSALPTLIAEFILIIVLSIFSLHKPSFPGKGRRLFLNSCSNCKEVPLHPVSLAKLLVVLTFVFSMSFFITDTHPAQAAQPSEWQAFPAGDVFKPLIADPKEPRFFVSVHNYDNEFKGEFTGASVGFGENFGIVKKQLGDQHLWQINLKGGLFSQFDLDTSSKDLLNSDYNIGITWTYRIEAFSMRARVYHQSSHLGDEFLIRHPRLADTRTDLDYEAIDWLGAFTWNWFRVYAGPHYLLDRKPSSLDRWGYHGGIEFLGSGEILPRGKLIAGLDIKGFQELDWTPAYSLKAGLSFKNLNYQNRYIQILLEYYNGFIPYGQFYDYDMDSYGLGVYFGF